MTIIVSNGSTLDIADGTGLTLLADGTVASGGLLHGAGTIVGNFTLLNQGTISADVPGPPLAINVGTLTNEGVIFADGGPISVQSSVTVTNLSNGVLTGGVWAASGDGLLTLLTGQVITNDATIILVGTASGFDGFDTIGGTLQPLENSLTTIGASGELALLNGRNFQAANSLVADGTIALGGGTLSMPGHDLTIGATGTIFGFGTIDPGTPVNVIGTIEAQGGTLTLPGVGNVTGPGILQSDVGASLALQAFGSYAEDIVNNGTIDAVFGGATGILGIAGAYSGTGSFLIQGGPDSADRVILELPSTVSADVAFDTNFGELLLDNASSFNGTISGFNNSDTIVLSGLGNAQNATLTGNLLKLNGSGGVLQTITLDTGSLDYNSAIFSVTENLANTQATLKVSGVQAACFAAGTRIRTRDGDVPVERLKEGDVVRAHFGGMAPVVWVGHRHVDCRRHAEPAKVFPVRISAHAFGPGVPSRDVRLSPDHAVFLDDVLIPIKHLINGKTIVQEEADSVTYYHVELAEHDVLLADGMAAESYLENGNRADFDNASGPIALHPDFGSNRWEAFGCAPLIVAGQKLGAVLARLGAASSRRGASAGGARQTG
jgi:hypothetical protein